jgi:hypothetical protein
LQQEAKITVSGESSEIVFKKDEYITMSEANTLFLQDKLIEQGVMNVG